MIHTKRAGRQDLCGSCGKKLAGEYMPFDVLTKWTEDGTEAVAVRAHPHCNAEHMAAFRADPGMWIDTGQDQRSKAGPEGAAPVPALSRRYLVHVENEPVQTFSQPKEAIDYAAKHVYLPPTSAEAADTALRVGRGFEYAYGFKSVTFAVESPGASPGELHEGPYFCLHSHVGDATASDGMKYEMMSGLPASIPIVKSGKTGKVFTLGWEDIIKLAVAKGVDA